jgi:hypothetical protein
MAGKLQNHPKRDRHCSFLIIGTHHLWQALQLVAEQVLQEELPPMGANSPEAVLEKEAKGESIREAWW